MAHKNILTGIPIGLSDYHNLITQGYYYVDKTLLVAQIWKAGQVILMPRPGRFGKTLNLSMLRYFFEKIPNATIDHEALFSNSLLLKNHPEYRELMGKYPVIFLTFKFIRDATWDESYPRFKRVITNEFHRHYYLFESLTNQRDRALFEHIYMEQASPADFATSLKLLYRLLYEYHKEKVIFILDEYDCPLHAGYHNNYYDAVVNFMRDLLSEALKDNVYLQKSFITGILSVAKEGIFSGLNNLQVLNILREKTADCFGFTDDEVKEMLNYYGMTEYASNIKAWYNELQLGSHETFYNPWAIFGYVDAGGKQHTPWTSIRFL